MVKRNPFTFMAIALVGLCLNAPVMAQGIPSSIEPSQDSPPPTPPSSLSPIDGVVGHWGFGYFTEEAPIGVRYWLDRKLAVDVGFDGAISSGNVEAYRLGFDVGAVYALAHYHYSVVFARAGLGYAYQGFNGPQPIPGSHQINGTAFLGAELFLGAFGFPNISLQGGYGLTASYSGGEGSAFIMGTSAAGLNVVAAGTLGFHIYL